MRDVFTENNAGELALGGQGDQLVVFSDDWARHPSSCQHLAKRLLGDYQTLWVNTIGTRLPALNWDDTKKVAAKVKQWVCSCRVASQSEYENLQVISPVMYPGFRCRWQRKLNAQLVSRKVNGVLNRNRRSRRIAVTTVPVTADMVGRLEVDRWVYYCVDDFSVWPGLDGGVMDEMERKLVEQVDAVVVVSQTLQDRIASMGRQSVMLTHGIDLDRWQKIPQGYELPQWFKALPRPVYLYWGLVDRRLDSQWCLALQKLGGTLVLAGPTQDVDERLLSADHIVLPGKMDYEDLPGLAAAADVLVMPYADLAVTRAMQPLKFKEYLATGKPVVVRDLPSMKGWQRCADVVGDVKEFTKMVNARVESGTCQKQIDTRGRMLKTESWEIKARQFKSILVGDSCSENTYLAA